MKTFYEKIESISFKSDLKNVNLAETLVDKIFGTYRIPEDLYGNILIAVTEAVTNAIQHGNQSDNSKIVTVSVEFNESELLFIIEDEGTGFDYDNLPDPTLPENIEKETGRGIFLIKSLADEVDFEENGTKIFIKFKLSK